MYIKRFINIRLDLRAAAILNIQLLGSLEERVSFVLVFYRVRNVGHALVARLRVRARTHYVYISLSTIERESRERSKSSRLFCVCLLFIRHI